MYYESEPKTLTLLENGSRWKIGAIYDNVAGFTNMSFVNGICTYNGGTHVKYIADQLAEKIIEIINKKNKKHLYFFIFKLNPVKLVMFWRSSARNNNLLTASIDIRSQYHRLILLRSIGFMQSSLSSL